jgi:hypothetical protein
MWPKSFTFSAVRHPILGIPGSKPRALSVAQMLRGEAAKEAPKKRKKRKRKSPKPG